MPALRLEQNVIMTGGRIRTFLIVCLPSCPSSYRGWGADRRICGRKEAFNQFPGPLLQPCWATFWVPGWPGLLPGPAFSQRRGERGGLLGRYGGQGRVLGGRVRRTVFHWTNLRSALRVLRPGAATGPSTPDHRFLCVQLSRETAKNRLKSLGFWN